MVKSGVDKYSNMTALVVGQLVFGGAFLPFVKVPTIESLPYLAGSVACHIGYQFFLLFSYRIGNLTHVYPIARGVGPLFVTAATHWSMGMAHVRLVLHSHSLAGPA